MSMSAIERTFRFKTIKDALIYISQNQAREPLSVDSVLIYRMSDHIRVVMRWSEEQ